MRTLKVFREHRGIASIPEVFFKSVKDYGPRPALSVFRDGAYQHLTYDELGHRVRWLSSGLMALGLSRGDRCAILGPNSPEWALAYLSILSAGGICVPTDSLLKGFEFRHIFEEAGVKFIFVAPKFLETVLEIDEELGIFKKIILFEKVSGDYPKKVTFLPEVMEKGRKHPKELRFPKLEEVAAIIYTSGTTGKAKGVMLTHRNIISDVAACYQSLPFDHRDRFLSVLPMHHTFECTAGFLLPLYAGCHITFARSLKSRDILADLKACQATVMLGVPLLFQKMYEGLERAIAKAPLLKKALFRSLMRMVRASERFGREEEAGKLLFRSLREKAGLGNIRFFVSGGAPLPPHLPKAFRRLGLKLLQGYGLTEASPVLTVNPPEAPKDESVGLPLPGVEVKIRNPNEEGVGELCFYGPMIMKGYYENPEATRATFDEEGFLQTGDLGYIDAEGYVHICGRAKNLIVTPAGKNVYPEEVEAELDKSPYILESMVFGFPKNGGEEVWAVIVPDYETIEREFHGKRLSEADVERLIAREVRSRMNRLADYKRVKKFIIQDEELPKTSTRKIKRHLVIPRLISDFEKRERR
ncbi:AMP-dependent synthetase/ligase [Thermosulfurimonas dismutans]|uniref:Long-chain-fatty-acid--CoA ligase n=1 Tax=Thermosulfurimonas dismutans TaxID=999894 RepID=A0A179D577_9BACT|nr:long-chain fatty acid--CoA ligase [Thermosulfurimonas dismutans]OAQ21250.1 Long-chain-fatty-acid--CoA ligase [Thermosulfurimonas dismutans]